jgi:hypothetical protein
LFDARRHLRFPNTPSSLSILLVDECSAMKADISTRDRKRPLADGLVPVRGAADATPRLSASPTTGAAIKHILVCVDGTDTDESVLDHALQVALRFSSHIDVLHVQFDVYAVTDEKRNEGLFDRLMAEPVERATIEASVSARRHFREWSARCRLPLRDSGISVRDASVG